MVKSFLMNTLKKLSLQKNGTISCAKNVVENLKQNTKGEERIAVRNVEENGITDIITTKQKVYNLTIEETPEYFANGVLVHNCWVSTTGVDHYVFSHLYAYLALLGSGSGKFYGELTKADKPEFIGNNNTVGDFGRLLAEANNWDE